MTTWFLQPTGSRGDTWKRPGLCGCGVSEVFWFDGVVGTRGKAVRQMLSAISPLVSFCNTQGSRTEELRYPSPCQRESFDRKHEGPFSGPSQACWSVATPIQVQNLGVKSTDKIPWEGQRWRSTAVAGLSDPEDPALNNSHLTKCPFYP